MTARRTCLAGEVHAGSYVLDDGVLHRLNFTQPVPRPVPGLPPTDVTWLFASGLSVTHLVGRVVDLPTAEEIAEARKQAEETGYHWYNFPPLGQTVLEVFGPMYAERCLFLPWTYLGSPCTEHLDGLHQCAELDTHPRHRCVCGAEYGEKPKPAPVGWPLGDGHRPTPPADAMTQDRYDNGEQA